MYVNNKFTPITRLVNASDKSLVKKIIDSLNLNNQVMLSNGNRVTIKSTVSITEMRDLRRLLLTEGYIFINIGVGYDYNFQAHTLAVSKIVAPAFSRKEIGIAFKERYRYNNDCGAAKEIRSLLKYMKLSKLN